jgi:NADH-quinone oxidoreductase subunit J
MITVIFYILAAITLATGALTVISRNPVHSAVYMIICFFSLAGHFLMLNATFLAVVHIIVYAGAIMVLLLFTLMLMNLNDTHEPKKKFITRVAATLSACLTAIVLLAVFLKAGPIIDTYKSTGIDFQSVNVLGQVLFEEYMIPFEFASILLITSMIGAVLVSKREKKKIKL